MPLVNLSASKIINTDQIEEIVVSPDHFGITMTSGKTYRLSDPALMAALNAAIDDLRGAPILPEEPPSGFWTRIANLFSRS